MRWWLDLFEEVGKNSEVWEILLLTSVEMVRSVIRAEEDKEKMKRYPFRLLFHSEASMDYILKNGLNYSSRDVERFNNLYLTPFFPLCVYDAVSIKFVYALLLI
jgi:hypothetical protein